MNANVDLIGKDQTVGEVAGRFAANGQTDFGRMRPFEGKDGNTYITVYKGGDTHAASSYVTKPINTNGATLRRDEWKQLDEVLLKVSMYRLGGIEDLISNGLTYQLGNAMGTTQLEWHDVSDAMEAVVTMDGITRGNNDRPVFRHGYLPIPIIHSDYEINARVLAASRSMGNPLDVITAELAARRVKEKLENMLFTDTTYLWGDAGTIGASKIYSYVNHPDRNLVNLSIPWSSSAITSAGILQDIAEAKAVSIAAHKYGPWMVYIPTAYEGVMDEDYSVAGSSLLTVRERIMKLGGIKGVKVVDTLAADNVLLVQMTSDVVRLVQGLGMQNIQWSVEGNFLTKYKIIQIAVPQIRSDYNGQSGIVHIC